MPSPFPGMDPFIESQLWPDFHHEMISSIRESLMPQMRPRYIAQVEERVYIEHPSSESNGRADVIRPDAVVVRRSELPASAGGGTAVAVATPPETQAVTLPVLMPERLREAYLVLRTRDTGEVITVIELLSPANKRSGSEGRREYLSKRDVVFLSPSHLVELDLLRGGERLPALKPLPPGDYYAWVSRRQQRPMVEVTARPLAARLPPIAIPLMSGDPDATLNLQAAFDRVYDRAGYDYALDYRRPVEPPLSEAELAWVKEQLDRGV